MGASVKSARPWKVTLDLFRQVLLLAGAILCFVVAVKGFILPNHLLTGGVTGMALLLHALFKWPVGLLTFLFNVPIFLLGWRDVGKRFVAYSGLSVVLFSLTVDHVPIGALTRDPLLASIFGGVIGGLGSALAIQAGGSLGGFDILGVVLNRRFSLGMGEVGLVLNGALVVASGLMNTPELAMYTLVGIFVGSRTLDTLQAPRPRKAALIVSRQSAAIKERILIQMARGVTLLKAEGAYSGEENNVLLCVLTRYELRELQDILKQEDPEAFVTVFEASDVIGRFKRPTAFDIWKKHQAQQSSRDVPPANP
jgi:uncharacterized membrane-anchored protein YitT (DUF2179 family)